MDFLLIIIICSFFVQIFSAFYAFALIKITNIKYYWLIISISLFLMGIRRFISLGFDNKLLFEIIGLFLSVFMLIGLIGIKTLFVLHQKREDKLKEYKENLERMVDERTNELRLEKEKFEKASKAKSDFIANLNHELRTPMTGMLGFLELLNGVETNPVNKKHLDIIKQSSEQLITIVNDILDISTIENGKYFIKEKEVNIYDNCLAISNVYEHKSIVKGIQFVFKFDNKLNKLIKIDEMSLLKIVNNLLSNAVKFTQSGKVTLSIKENDNNYIEIKVKDTGIGISQDKKDRLFEPFDQGEYFLTKRYGGTGLGLAIVKRITNLLNGEIKVWTKEGKGTEFIIILPFKN